MKTAALVDSVVSLRPFVPAKDLEISMRFYSDLGFQLYELGPDLVDVRLGNQAFLLQRYYVEAWANNFMMHLLVKDIDAWWDHLSPLDLTTRYGVPPPRAPKVEPWGLKVAYVIDPSGVLWHIAADVPPAN